MEKMDLSFLHDIKTPLILAGLVVAVAIPIFNKVVQPATNRAAVGLQRQVARYVFILALVSILLGAAGYVLDFVPTGGSVFHGKVIENGDPSEGIAGATVDFYERTDSTIQSDANGDFAFPYTEAQVGRVALVWAKHEDFKTSEKIQITVGQDGVVGKNLEISLIPNNSAAVAVSTSAPAATVPATAPTAVEPSAANFQAVYDTVKTNELDLSRWGENAFAVASYDWAEKFLTQARAVQSSGVWQSNYPYLGAAMMLQGKDDDGKAVFEEMLGRIHTEIQQGSGYLGWQITLGFVLESLGKVRSKVTPADQAYLDEVIDKVTALKATARP